MLTDTYFRALVVLVAMIMALALIVWAQWEQTQRECAAACSPRFGAIERIDGKYVCYCDERRVKP